MKLYKSEKNIIVNFENEFIKLGNKVVKPVLRHHRLGYIGSEELGNTSIFDYVADLEVTIKKLKQKLFEHGTKMQNGIFIQRKIK